jgi:hypothetical protein
VFDIYKPPPRTGSWLTIAALIAAFALAMVGFLGS